MEHIPAWCKINGCENEASWWIDTEEWFTETLLGVGPPNHTFYLCSDHYGEIQNENGNYTHVRIDTGEIYDIDIGGYLCHDECEVCQ